MQNEEDIYVNNWNEGELEWDFDDEKEENETTVKCNEIPPISPKTNSIIEIQNVLIGFM
jgi:hypothetical protein